MSKNCQNNQEDRSIEQASPEQVHRKRNHPHGGRLETLQPQNTSLKQQNAKRRIEDLSQDSEMIGYLQNTSVNLTQGNHNNSISAGPSRYGQSVHSQPVSERKGVANKKMDSIYSQRVGQPHVVGTNAFKENADSGDRYLNEPVVEMPRKYTM